MATATLESTVSEAVNQILPRIRERREEVEQNRQLPRDLAEALTATGIFRIGVPRALGGDEATPGDMLKVIEAISAADGSTGWCAMIGVIVGTVGGYMPDAGARGVFADPSAPKALVAEPSGAAMPSSDGLRVTGRWRFASGITHADWLAVGCVVMENGQPRMTSNGPDIRHMFVPRSDVQIHDTWHVSGLCGTGSADVSVDDVFVPAERIFSIFDPTEYRPEPLYQMPVFALVAPPTAMVGVGIARGALDEVTELLATKTPALSMVRAAEKPAAQIELARAEGALGAARAFLYETLDALWQTVSAGNRPTIRQQSLCRIASNHATEVAASVTRTASTLAGATSVYNASPLQRHARDVDVITHHMTQSPHVWEDAGRTLLGLEPLAPIF